MRGLHVWALTGTLLLGAGCAGARAAPHPPKPTPCERELAVARAALPQIPEESVEPHLAVTVAMTLFRFNRVHQAGEKLARAIDALRGAWTRRVPADRLREANDALERLRICISSAQPPPLATLTVHAFDLDPHAVDVRGKPVAGAYVDVEGIAVGRTDEGGTLTVLVPSGEVAVTARTPSTAWGEAAVTLAPGASGTVAVVLDPDKEVIERTDVRLVELLDGILPSSATTVTLQFEDDGRLVPVTRIDRVEWRDGDQNVIDLLEELFTVVDGLVSARDPASVLARLSNGPAGRIGLVVQAQDGEGFTHAGEVWFRVEPRR